MKLYVRPCLASWPAKGQIVWQELRRWDPKALVDVIALMLVVEVTQLGL